MDQRIQIVDLDNCISNDEWRIPRINWELQGEERWDEYHTLVEQDQPCNIERLCVDIEDVPIVIFTARPEKFRAKTRRWLANVTGLSERVVCIYMRPDGDNSSSVNLKQSFLDDLAESRAIYPEHILVAYDDREDVVEMYKSRGINAEVLKIHDTCAYTDPAKLIHPTAVGASNILNGSVRPSSIVLTGCTRPDNCASSSSGLCCACGAAAEDSVNRSTVDRVLREMIETYLKADICLAKERGKIIKRVQKIA